MQCVKIVNIWCFSAEVITTYQCLHISLYSLNESVHRMCKDNHHVATPSFRMNKFDLKNNFKPLNYLVTTSFLRKTKENRDKKKQKSWKSNDDASEIAQSYKNMEQAFLLCRNQPWYVNWNE